MRYSHGELVQLAEEGRRKKMPRYIDAAPYEDGRIVLNKEDAGVPVAEIPTADVVEVVRCHDCEYWDPGSPMATVIPTPCRCRLRREAFGMTAEDFCSYGRRKTDAEVE